MKFINKFAFLGVSGILASALFSCSDKNDEPKPDDLYSKTIGFQDAPLDLFGSSAYGENLYNGDISKGYITQILNDIYVQFPVNYGYNYDSEGNLSYCYTLYNGGFALSNYHDMTDASYLNQLSVYNTSSTGAGKFIVATGYGNQDDPSNAVYSDYDGCAKIYFTDSKGYGVSKTGEEARVSGDDKEGWIKSVAIANTTYTYLTMLNGNDFTQPLSETHGWFKVQFVAFKNDDQDGKPIGFTEVFLANYDKNQSTDLEGIRDEWYMADLSGLPECSVVAVNFVGSDKGEWGLNTPAYCALDAFVFVVDKD